MAFAFFIKLSVSVASKVDFIFFKALEAPKTILALEGGNKLAIGLKSCFISFLTELSSTTGWTALCSYDTTTPFTFSYKKTDKGLSI